MGTTTARLLALGGFVLAGCAGLVDEGDPGSETEALTAVTGSAHTIEFDGYVYVPAGADDDAVRAAIRMQVKSSLGALKELEIGIEDRDAQHNLDPSSWRRAGFTVVEPDGRVAEVVDRVTYHYVDRALVRGPSASPLELHMLFGDYPSRAAELVPSCSDDADADPGSLWYHFTPGRSACRRAIRAEEESLAAAVALLDDPSTELPREELDRRFLTVRATLTPHATPPDLYPEYDRIFETDDGVVVAYAFFGVDRDVSSPVDHGLRETLRFQRALRRAMPGLRVARTWPGTGLLDYSVGGTPVDGVTFDDVESWMLEDAGYPAEVGADLTLREGLRRQVVERYAERWVVWEREVEVSLGGETTELLVEVRSFYGEEDGSHEAREAARGRYLEAFWNGAVFAYTGHSHFGYGPLSPDGYGAWAFPDRYQVMLVNSCLSYNYYDADFLEMHPGGTASLDVVVNGLAAYWPGMGEATAAYVAGLLGGAGGTWRDLLEGMRVDLPWERGYDPMRAVNGELDNVFDPATTPLVVTEAPARGDWQRTVVLVEAVTEPGQDLFLRGGLDHAAALERLGVDCRTDPWLCAVPIRHRNLRNPTTRDWKQGDRHLDWHGREPGQSAWGAEGTPADWTTDSWPAAWGPPRTVRLDGYGEEPLNSFGPHYWMLDVEMDCDATLDGWFELKAFVARGAGWEPDIGQPDAPYESRNHFGRCGRLNVFRFGDDAAEVLDLD